MGNALHPKQWPSKFYATLKRTDICKLSICILRRDLILVCPLLVDTIRSVVGHMNKRHQHVGSNRTTEGTVHSETDMDSFVSLLMIFVSRVFCLDSCDSSASAIPDAFG